MAITENLIEEAGQLLKDAMMTYRTQIDKAYLGSGRDDGQFKVGLSIEFAPSKKKTDSITMKAGISFVTSQIKDTFTRDSDYKQGKLFDPDIPCPATTSRPWMGSVMNGGACLVHEARCEKCEHYTHPACASWADNRTRENIDRMLHDIDVDRNVQVKKAA